MYRAELFNSIQIFCVVVFNAICAYFQTTSSFMLALFLAFFFNVLAGMKADNVSIKQGRLCNFSGCKFKDCLIELLLVIVITYFLKGIADIMDFSEDTNIESIYVVKVLVCIALWRYVANGLRNLSLAYPRNVWVRFVFYLLSFKISEFMPKSIRSAWSKANESNEI